MSPFVIPFPAIDPVAVSFGPFAIRWYALAYIVGLLIGWRYCLGLSARPPRLIGRQDVDDFLIWATLGVVLGGRIGYVLFYNPGYYIYHPMEALSVWHGGMSFHGGALPRHPSQLYEAFCEGILLFFLLFAAERLHARQRPGVVTGLFLVGYAAARMSGELFREPDPQLGFLIFGTTMGQLLSIPLLIAGILIIGSALRAPAPARP